MMFKGPSLRLTCLGLSALLWLAGAGRLQAQTTSEGSSYRILLMDNLTQAQARNGKQLLDGIHLAAPVHMEEINGHFRFTYGDFPTQAAAAAAEKSIYENEGLRSRGILVIGPTAAPPASSQVFTIHIRDFKTYDEANKLKQKLDPQFGTVMIRQTGDFYEVLVGQYDVREASVALGQLKKLGYPNAETRPLLPAIPAPVLPAVARPTSENDDNMLPITHSPQWQAMSLDEQRRMRDNVALQIEFRKNDPLAQELIDQKKRLEKLDDTVRKMIDESATTKIRIADERSTITHHIEMAENFIKEGSWSIALKELQAALDRDKDNAFGQRAFIKDRITYVNARMAGQLVPDEDKVTADKIKNLRARAVDLMKSNDINELQSAIDRWNEIKDLDHNQNVASNIAQIKSKINSIRDSDKAEAAKNTKLVQNTILGLIGGVAFLALLVLWVWMRTRKRHMELMRKVQEITSIRPMRELEGSGPQLLGGTDTDIFTPANPAADGGAGDPLGGVLTPPAPPDKKGKGKKGKGAPEPAPAAAPAEADPLDDIFGGGNAPAVGGDDMGLDDIFGGPSTPAAQPTVKAVEEPTASSTGGAIDDIFGGLFADETPAADAKPNGQAPHMSAEEPSHGSPISFDDIVSSAGHDSTATSDDTEDLLAVFDEPAPAVAGKANGQEVDPLQDSPFAAMFNDLSSPDAVGAGVSAKDNDTEIPSIKLDATGGATQASPASFGGMDLHDISKPSAGPAESLDLPVFSFDDLVGATSIGNGSGTPGVEIDFDGEPAGQHPKFWEGEYPFAQLTVEADTPPKGSQQYLSFVKKEGAGKAHFSYHFGEISGVVGIEFDLRCNDKNKFLLGFYVEKDGDFQHSINTKILRSEAQTSPTIHMQGQSAPYLLGSWAHIKYVVDLGAGKVNGYIDSTHVVRDLPLTPNPGSLNTLSIRDNINTTGVLLLANIKVYAIQ